MTANTQNTGREMTTAELARLHRLNMKFENAKNFTQSSKALEQMNSFQERLMAKGVPAEAILEAMGN